jgi:hypothetical protein
LTGDHSHGADVRTKRENGRADPKHAIVTKKIPAPLAPRPRVKMSVRMNPNVALAIDAAIAGENWRATVVRSEPGLGRGSRSKT